MSTRQERSVAAAAFSSRELAEHAIESLMEIGLGIEAVGVAMRRHDEQDTLIENTGAHKAAEPIADIVTGGLIGGVTGAILSFGVLAVPGVGPVIASGVLASTLAGAGIGAATGGIRSAFTDLGFSGAQADILEARFIAGDAIVTVEIDAVDGAVGKMDQVRQALSVDAAVVEFALPPSPVV